MKRRWGLLLAGGVAMLLLEPSGGARRRARVKQWLEPVQGQIGKLRGRAAPQEQVPDEQDRPSLLTRVQHVAQTVQTPFQAATGAFEQPSANGTGSNATSSPAQTADQDRAQAIPASPTQSAAQADPSAEELAPSPGIDPIPEGETNDPTLVARIESELFRDPAIPKGHLNIDAANGVVTLRGTVNDDALARDIVERTGAVEGVDKVVDLLHRGSV